MEEFKDWLKPQGSLTLTALVICCWRQSSFKTQCLEMGTGFFFISYDSVCRQAALVICLKLHAGSLPHREVNPGFLLVLREEPRASYKISPCSAQEGTASSC